MRVRSQQHSPPGFPLNTQQVPFAEMINQFLQGPRVVGFHVDGKESQIAEAISLSSANLVQFLLKVNANTIQKILRWWT